jgi:hypothetical protein
MLTFRAQTMQQRLCTYSAMTAFCLFSPSSSRAFAQDAEIAARSGPARKATERALTFLQTDAAKWREEHACATCHHGTMTVWAFAMRPGFLC